MGDLSNGSDFTKPLKWLILALSIKILLYFLFIHNDTNPRRSFSGCFIRSADHYEYIRPVDNLIDKGSYSMDGVAEPYAGRLPGFVFPYIVFRAILNEHAANIALGIFILTLSVLAGYIFSLLLFDLTRKRWAFITGFLLLNFVPFFWHYDWTLHTNSLAASSLIFFSYFIHCYILNGKNKHLLFAGFFMAWLVLLRGFCLVFIPVAFIFLIYFIYKKKNSIREVLISSALFILPFMIFETVWITRNYISFHKLIPLQTSFVPGSDPKDSEYGNKTITKPSMMNVRKLIFAWGGDNTWYFKNTDMAWFANKSSDITAGFKFDDAIFFEGFTKDSLKLLRSSIIYSYETIMNAKSQDSIENVISTTSLRLHKKFIEQKKMYCYFYAPLKRLKNYLLRNVTQDWPGLAYNNSNLIQKFIKIICLAEYLLLNTLLLIFPFVFFKYRKQVLYAPIYLFFYVLILANIFPFLFFIYMSHFSYFIYGTVLLVPLLIFVIEAFKSKRVSSNG